MILGGLTGVTTVRPVVAEVLQGGDMIVLSVVGQFSTQYFCDIAHMIKYRATNSRLRLLSSSLRSRVRSPVRRILDLIKKNYLVVSRPLSDSSPMRHPLA
jgi:hypothetical protein